MLLKINVFDECYFIEILTQNIQLIETALKGGRCIILRFAFC